MNLSEHVIKVIPRKTRKHAHGRPVVIPIHPMLEKELNAVNRGQYVFPEMATNYQSARWRVSDGVERIFKKAGIEMNVRIEGRRYRAPEATFHSLRHTFVSFAANAGVPIPVVQSIVGHTSTAMTRHYYHENEEALRNAVAAIPNLDSGVEVESGDRMRRDVSERCEKRVASPLTPEMLAELGRIYQVLKGVFDRPVTR